MKHIILWIIALATFISCQEDQPDRVLKPSNLDSQFFTIHPDRDTILWGKGGTQLIIKANTLAKTAADGTVTIELKEALTKADMVKGGLVTQTVDGQILESGGMVFLEVDPAQKINGEGIGVQVPTGSINDQMQLFTLENSRDPQSGWKVVGDVKSEPTAVQIANGKKLFKTYCASCHNTDLRQILTGPALGNVHLFRELEWLIEFTNNSQQMIAGGDTLARCVWNQWKPVQMQDFDSTLTRTEIIDIYRFIQNESAVQQIGPTEVEFVMECEIRDVNQIEGFVFYSVNSYGSLDTIKSFSYMLKAEQFGWINIDYFLRTRADNLEEAERFIVEIIGEKEYDFYEGYVVFQSRNIVLPLYQSGDFYSTWGKEKILLPVGEKVYLVAMALNNGYWFGAKEVTIGQKNRHQLEVHPSSEGEIQQFVEGL